jgi:hypothetical protein
MHEFRDVEVEEDFRTSSYDDALPLQRSRTSWMAAAAATIRVHAQAAAAWYRSHAAWARNKQDKEDTEQETTSRAASPLPESTSEEPPPPAKEDLAVIRVGALVQPPPPANFSRASQQR